MNFDWSVECRYQGESVVAPIIWICSYKFSGQTVPPFANSDKSNFPSMENSMNQRF